MFDRFTYKQKNYALLGVFVLLCMVSYKRSFSLTLNAQDEIAEQESQLAKTDNVQTDIESLVVQINQLNRNIGKSDIAPDKVSQEILSEISAFSSNNPVELVQLEKTHSFQTVDFDIFSNQILVEGNYNGILSLSHYMENNFEYARLTNVELFTEENHNSKSKKLYGKLLFQHYRQN